jgi:tetratricopeptide (TPR) repeat protein
MRSQVTVPCAAALLLAFASSIFAQSGPASDPGSMDFSARRQYLLHLAADAYDKQGAKPGLRHAFWIAEALMELGRTDDALKLANAALENLEPGNKINRWLYGGNTGFIAWPALDFYLRYKDRLDDSTRRRYARIYQGAIFYRRLTTSNHTLMAATERYLATQEWGEHFAPDPLYVHRPDVAGTRFSADDPTGEKFLNRRLNELILGGAAEYASRPYGSQDILPFLTLAECSRDPGMKTRALRAYQCAIAELAGTYLQGHVATFSTRSYPDLLAQQPWGVASLLWTYFGGAGVAPKIDWGLRAATTSLSLPDAVMQAGTDRSKPYTQRSVNGGWRLTTYMTPTYAVFSRSPKGSAKPPVLLGQNYPCGAMFLEPNPARNSFIWLTNPCADSDGKRSPSGIHTHGVTRNEQEVQDQGSILFAFDISPQAPFPYALGFIPGGYEASINDAGKSGRIFLAYKSMLIAISSTKPFSWNPAAGILHLAGKPAPGDSEYRIDGPQIAVAFDSAAPGDFPGDSPAQKLSAFAGQVEQRGKIELTAVDPVAAHLVDHAGNDLTCTFGGRDSINGADIDYDHWPRLSNPWLKVEAPGAAKLGASLSGSSPFSNP